MILLYVRDLLEERRCQHHELDDEVVGEVVPHQSSCHRATHGGRSICFRTGIYRGPV